MTNCEYCGREHGEARTCDGCGAAVKRETWGERRAGMLGGYDFDLVARYEEAYSTSWQQDALSNALNRQGGAQNARFRLGGSNWLGLYGTK